MDIAGIIDQIGSKVNGDLKIGQKVVGMVIPAGQHGAYRQQIKLSERGLTLALMVNMNKYGDGEYPTSDAYKSYMKILSKILIKVSGKVLWQVPILG